ncbi:hypothetical protein [Hyphomonas sp.]|uniref:hypothetical protein n=1 Tax=Hyphomonas sp. TaxID=87 RepID=UPI0025C2CF01|nr:hypothetical protein [Hyphomonas sp.]
MSPDEIVAFARTRAPKLHPLTDVLGSPVLLKDDGGFESITWEIYTGLGMASGTGRITSNDPAHEARMNRPEVRRRITLAMMTNSPSDLPPGGRLSIDLMLPGDEPLPPRDEDITFSIGWVPDEE